MPNNNNQKPQNNSQHHGSPPSPHSPSSPSTHNGTHGAQSDPQDGSSPKKPTPPTQHNKQPAPPKTSPTPKPPTTNKKSAPKPKPVPAGGTVTPPSTTPGSAGTRPTSINEAIVAMLKNIAANGYNPHTNGLYINWRTGTSPLQTNLSGSGQTDTTRHDPLTDLRYVHALLLYKAENPQDSQFDGELAKYSAIVKAELGTKPSNPRGWVYDILIDLYHLSNDQAYQQDAHSLAANWYASYQHGLPTGKSFRVDEAVECACALIQEGTIANQPTWTATGKQLLDKLYQVAYVPSAKQFLFQINADGTIYRGQYLNEQIEGGQVRPGAVAQEVLSLLHTAMVTQDQGYVSKATDILDQFTIADNRLGLWDSTNEGYFSALIFPGASVSNPGQPTVNQGKKESGRQMQMLEAFALANHLTNGKYQAEQDALITLFLDKIYDAQAQGVVYERHADWSPVAVSGGSGQYEDWVTTEAMGISFEGLFATMSKTPW